MYTLADSSYYKKMIIQDKPIYIFDDHNMALPVWGKYAAELEPLHLITFDTHTDTHPAFNKYLKVRGKNTDPSRNRIVQLPDVKELLSSMHYQRNDFLFEDVWRYSLEMPNTEQILTGVIFGYLDSYSVRCHHEGFEEDDRRFGYDATYISDEDKRVPQIRDPLILDIDLDYFRSPDEMRKEFIDYFKPYFEAACVVTIAREPRFFDAEKTVQSFTVQGAESRLLQIMNQIDVKANI